MIFCARGTRAMEDPSAPIPEELTSQLGGIVRNLARRPQWNQQGCHSQGVKQASLEEALDVAVLV